jgi:hypothetical protein
MPRLLRDNHSLDGGIFGILLGYLAMEALLSTTLPSPTALEDTLRNGVLLCCLATFVAPDLVTEKQIYDADMAVWQVCVLV